MLNGVYKLFIRDLKKLPFANFFNVFNQCRREVYVLIFTNLQAGSRLYPQVIMMNNTTINTSINMILAVSLLRTDSPNEFRFLFSMFKSFIDQRWKIIAVQVVSEADCDVLFLES